MAVASSSCQVMIVRVSDWSRKLWQDIWARPVRFHKQVWPALPLSLVLPLLLPPPRPLRLHLLRLLPLLHLLLLPCLL